MDEKSRAMLKEAGVDYDLGLDRFDGNAELFEKFIKRFPEDTSLDSLRHALASDDGENAYRAAHTLKGVVGNLSFTPYFDLMTTVAKDLREGDLAGAKELMPAVEKAHADILDALQRLP